MPAAQNHLIELLPRDDRQRLLAVCKPVELMMGQVLCERGEPASNVFLPVHGFVSQLTQVDRHPSLEVGLVGREGMLGSTLLLGVETVPLRALVQGPGAAWCVNKADFVQLLEHSTALHSLVKRFIFVRMAQMAGQAACLRFHLIGQRLARWLLMSQDRAHAAEFHVTHEFLASMLGVRRVGVTAAAGLLQRQGLISYHRGEVTVRDRSGLEHAACSCYAADRAVYHEHLA